MRDQAAIVETAFDIKRVQAAHIALRDAEAKSEASTKKAKRDREAVAERKLELGRELNAARASMPARGTKEHGWLKFLQDIGIARQRADECIELYRRSLVPDSTKSGTSNQEYESEDSEDPETDSEAGVIDDQDEDDDGIADYEAEVARRRKSALDVDRELSKLRDNARALAEAATARDRQLIAHELRLTAKAIEEMP